MNGSKGRVWLAAAAVCGAMLSVPAVSHFDDKEMPQSYRQSYFALLAANFGPMVSSVKGEVPWDQVKMENWANDLAALSTLDVMRGFVDGSAIRSECPDIPSSADCSRPSDCRNCACPSWKRATPSRSASRSSSRSP